MEEREKQGVDAHRSRLQFSLQAVFWFTTGVAILCSVLFAMPDSALATALLSSIVLGSPAVLTIMVIYGRDYLRTFAIGALFPAVFMLLPLFEEFDHMLFAPDIPGWLGWFFHFEEATTEIRPLVLCTLVIGFLVGLMAVATRWCIEKEQRRYQAAGKESHGNA